MKISIFLALLATSLPLLSQDGKPTESSTPSVAKSTAEKLQKLTPIFDGKTLNGWISAPNAWVVKNGAMASTGAGRGEIYTQGEYGHFRLVFQVRHVSGQPDHQAGVLIFCAKPKEGEKLNALSSVQFQVPNGGHWDYRPGQNKAGTNVFTKVPHPKFDPHEWSQVEILANAKTGTARMAVAQPVGTRAVEVLAFKTADPIHAGPVAWQMHNPGLFDEYRDVRIEVDPREDELITVR